MENSKDEDLIVNSDDEVVAFYSNNRVKKFQKKPFSPKSRAGEVKGSFSKKINEEKKIEKKEIKGEEAKVEKKSKGDSGIDCHYCNGVNHMENDCMLRKRDENKNRVKDEAYYLERLKEVREKTKGVSLVVKGEDEDMEPIRFGNQDQMMKKC